jgi:hypothetical protein
VAVDGVNETVGDERGAEVEDMNDEAVILRTGDMEVDVPDVTLVTVAAGLAPANCLKRCE